MAARGGMAFDFACEEIYLLLWCRAATTKIERIHTYVHINACEISEMLGNFGAQRITKNRVCLGIARAKHRGSQAGSGERAASVLIHM